MKISYNWLKWYIPEVPPADKLVDIFNYHLCEMESLEKLGTAGANEDVVFDLKILPNRAHDLLSHQGVARELASLLNINYKDPTPLYKVPESKLTKLKIEINTEKDRRHVGRIIRNVKVGPSPEWVVSHLAAVGQRSINNIVDATNLTMFDCGQPTHAFDLNKVARLKLNIRNAKKGDKVTLLTGEEKELNSTMIAITDGEDNILDTGIKGGKHAEITTATTDIILEADNFDPVFARKTGQALNISTDARKRFENDLSPELASKGILELSALIFEMCPSATLEDIVDIYPQKQEIRKLSFSTDKISKILGLEVSIAEIKDILKRYNFEFRENSGKFEITVPYMRLDLCIEEDMAEEIGRILGYDKVKGSLPKINFIPKQNETHSKVIWARNKLLDEGYSEVMNSSFSNRGEVEVLASASDKKFLRTNLTDGLKASLKLNRLNAPLLGLKDVKIFEIGTIFKKGKEEMHVAYGDKKIITETRLIDFCKEMRSDFSLEPRNYNLKPNFKMWSLFPFIARDVAVWVPEGIASEDVEEIIKENMGNMVARGPELFDEFKKGNQISYAFRLVFQSDERTLTDQEVNDIMSKITNKIKDKKTNGAGWQVR